MKKRSYNQFCALASALDIIGERWNLLIIRELLTGPRRYTDLIDGLPGISTNLLAERLKELEELGIIRRCMLPPPAGSTVYQLTSLGQALETSMIELGKWGSRFLPASCDEVNLPSVGAISLAIKAFFHPQTAQGMNETYELHLDQEVLQVNVSDGEISVHQGQYRNPDAIFYTTMQVFVDLFTGQFDPDEAVANDLLRIEGDPDTLKRFLRLSKATV